MNPCTVLPSVELVNSAESEDRVGAVQRGGVLKDIHSVTATQERYLQKLSLKRLSVIVPCS